MDLIQFYDKNVYLMNFFLKIKMINAYKSAMNTVYSLF